MILRIYMDLRWRMTRLQSPEATSIAGEEKECLPPIKSGPALTSSSLLHRRDPDVYFALYRVSGVCRVPYDARLRFGAAAYLLGK